MKTFKSFIKEIRATTKSENWMYHGTNRKIDGPLRPNDGIGSEIHDRLGVHYAADHRVSHVFAQGVRRKEPIDGDPHPAIFRFKRPPNSKFIKVKQRPGEYDNTSVHRHVIHTVFSHPKYGKEHFVNWHYNGMGTSRHTSEMIHKRLSMGKHVDVGAGDKSKTVNSFKAYLDHHRAHSSQQHTENDRHHIVKTYHKIMKERGIHGLVYHNTDTEETKSVRDRHDDGRPAGSTKTYIMFDGIKR